MVDTFGAAIVTGITGSFLVAAILMILCIINENKTVSIYLQPAEIKNGKVDGWHCVQCDWFWLRGMMSVLWCYCKWMFTFGGFKFDWESR